MTQPLRNAHLPRVQKHPREKQRRCNKLHDNQQIQTINGIMESPLSKISEPTKQIR